MHACLNVDEIVRLITGELIQPNVKSGAVALACCRNSFEDPVLDTLWERQDRLLPLVESLPGDIWNEDEHTVSTPTVCVFSSLNSFERLSKDARQHWNGPVSGSTPEGCEISTTVWIQTSCLRRCSRFYSFAPPANPCFRT